MKQSYQDAFGNINLVIIYDTENQWVHADFIGAQSLVSIQRGMNAVLQLLIDHKCSKYLSDNTHLYGGWNIANDWLRDVWTPLAMQAGMRYVAHIMAPGFFGRHSMEELAPGLPSGLNIQFFENIAEAKTWLASC